MKNAKDNARANARENWSQMRYIGVGRHTTLATLVVLVSAISASVAPATQLALVPSARETTEQPTHPMRATRVLEHDTWITRVYDPLHSNRVLSEETEQESHQISYDDSGRASARTSLTKGLTMQVSRTAAG
jgi:YD repeat-containing protein